MSKYDQYDLFKHTDSHITRPRFSAERAAHFYPSEASVEIIDQYGDKIVHGGCLRASYYRLTSEITPQPNEARSEWIFAMGIAIEKILIEQWKEMGIWVANNVKFLDAVNNISGELDAVLIEPNTGKLYIGEIKSTYGYMSEKELFGNKTTKPFPKMNHLLQILTYLNYFRGRIDYGRLIYFMRDSVKRKTFIIELFEKNGLLYPMVDGEIITSFSIEDVLNRYRLLSTCINNHVVPDRDYELDYSDEKIEDQFKKGKIAKTKYEKWQKGKLAKYEHVGDWNCSYCRFCNICYSNDAIY